MLGAAHFIALRFAMISFASLRCCDPMVCVSFTCNHIRVTGWWSDPATQTASTAYDAFVQSLQRHSVVSEWTRTAHDGFACESMTRLVTASFAM